jgi:hypothetical protein
MPMDWGPARDYAARDVQSGETPVTEAEWLAATNPGPMLGFLGDRASERKLRLLAAACCRRIWHLLIDERSRNAVAVAERFADGLATEAELASANLAARAAIDVLRPGRSDTAAIAVVHANSADVSTLIRAGAAAYTAARAADQRDDPANGTNWDAERGWQAGVVRDVFGDPFCPVAFVPAWRTPTAAKLIQVIYNEQAFDRLPLLADALEDAGCTDADLLGHLRSPGQHVRGCWAVDLVLGRE